MNIIEEMKQFNIDIDDVRWYLCVQKSKELMVLKETPGAFITYMHSKKLEADLYNMEENFLNYLQSELNNRKMDEASIRETLYRINREKTLRQQGRLTIEVPKQQFEEDDIYEEDDE